MVADRDTLGKEIIRDLYQEGMIRTWYRDRPSGWTLVSGLWSPFYIQLRPLCSYPTTLKKVGQALGRVVKDEIGEGCKLVGVAMAGIPLAVAVSILEDMPSLYTRKLEGVGSAEEIRKAIEKYGEHSMLEGDLRDRDNLVIVDDLVTRFDSKLIAIEQVKYEAERRGLSNVRCENVVVLLDREQGAEEAAKKHGIGLHSLIPFLSRGIAWLEEFLSETEYSVITDYLSDPDKYQDKGVQTGLKNEARNRTT